MYNVVYTNIALVREKPFQTPPRYDFRLKTTVECPERIIDFH